MKIENSNGVFIVKWPLGLAVGVQLLHNTVEYKLLSKGINPNIVTINFLIQFIPFQFTLRRAEPPCVLYSLMGSFTMAPVMVEFFAIWFFAICNADKL